MSLGAGALKFGGVEKWLSVRKEVSMVSMVPLQAATSKGNVTLIQSVEYLSTNTYQSWGAGGGGGEKLSV